MTSLLSQVESWEESQHSYTAATTPCRIPTVWTSSFCACRLSCPLGLSAPDTAHLGSPFCCRFGSCWALVWRGGHPQEAVPWRRRLRGCPAHLHALLWLEHRHSDARGSHRHLPQRGWLPAGLWTQRCFGVDCIWKWVPYFFFWLNYCISSWISLSYYCSQQYSFHYSHFSPQWPLNTVYPTVHHPAAVFLWSLVCCLMLWGHSYYCYSFYSRRNTFLLGKKPSIIELPKARSKNTPSFPTPTLIFILRR